VIHDDLAARNGQINPDVKSLSLLAVLMRNFDHHPASHNAVIKLREFLRLLTNSRFHRRGRIHIAKRDLYRQLHHSFS